MDPTQARSYDTVPPAPRHNARSCLGTTKQSKNKIGVSQKDLTPESRGAIMGTEMKETSHIPKSA